ncbi:hypothetical protein FN846DRAFT_284977 [Sphaerosporella brunnea]|uniref:Uncharacterized protein n=1 Tax=Sphaerosporella brunnea TaxID=1250544 RepID=A0A5J5ELT3_9PEZI|nr:hypothetical protein FN846DRAFT_284977 [Sphaerosporella brunnea]
MLDGLELMSRNHVRESQEISVATEEPGAPGMTEAGRVETCPDPQRGSITTSAPDFQNPTAVSTHLPARQYHHETSSEYPQRVLELFCTSCLCRDPFTLLSLDPVGSDINFSIIRLYRLNLLVLVIVFSGIGARVYSAALGLSEGGDAGMADNVGQRPTRVDLSGCGVCVKGGVGVVGDISFFGVIDNTTEWGPSVGGRWPLTNCAQNLWRDSWLQ